MGPGLGGFYRYADAADWSQARKREDARRQCRASARICRRRHAAPRSGMPSSRLLPSCAGSGARWPTKSNGGFFNAQSSRNVDKTMYVDRNAMMVGAFIRAAALFDDIWLRDFALKSLEAVIVPAYTSQAMASRTLRVANGGNGVRGLLTDQIHVASALIWAHAATGQLPYSMLAAEVMQFAIRTMWDEAGGQFPRPRRRERSRRAVRAQLPCSMRARSAWRAHGRCGVSGSRPRDSAVACSRL